MPEKDVPALVTSVDVSVTLPKSRVAIFTAKRQIAGEGPFGAGPQSPTHADHGLAFVGGVEQAERVLTPHVGLESEVAGCDAARAIDQQAIPGVAGAAANRALDVGLRRGR